MAHAGNLDSDATPHGDEALRLARREQRRIAIFNQPHCYKLTLLDVERPVANDDLPSSPLAKSVAE